ncbi:MAG: hypothetical protein NW216_10395 [Hyphomicrobium sp.]|nr:hypothetical protein [Hyphomicrobium sp.]
MWPFTGFVLAHIVTGTVGLITFWIVVGTRKGSPAHRYWGKVFSFTMLATGTIAIAISLSTLIDPSGTHPHIADLVLVENIFGWMMLYLAILTINLAWQGWLAITNGRDHAKNRAWHNWALQALLVAASLNCAIRGLVIGQPLMIGISTIGFATVATNVWFLMKDVPARHLAINEHIKALVGAGISVYTAFFAFGAVRMMPDIALNPVLWAVPLVVGLSLIVYHQREVRKRYVPDRNQSPIQTSAQKA